MENGQNMLQTVANTVENTMENERRTQNRCTYRGNGSFQLQNAANSMENGENRKSKKTFPKLKKKNPQTISYPLVNGYV